MKKVYLYFVNINLYFINIYNDFAFLLIISHYYRINLIIKYKTKKNY